MIEEGNGEVAIEGCVVFVGYTYRDDIGRGVGLVIQLGEGTQSSVGVEGKSGGVLVDQREGQGGVGIGVGGGEVPDYGAGRLVFQDARAIEFERVGGCVGN